MSPTTVAPLGSDNAPQLAAMPVPTTTAISDATADAPESAVASAPSTTEPPGEPALAPPAVSETVAPEAVSVLAPAQAFPATPETAPLAPQSALPAANPAAMTEQPTTDAQSALAAEPVAGGEGATAPAAPQVAAATERPALPADPGTGMAELVDGAGTNDRLEVALTFDAGSDLGYTSEILDVLQQEGIKVTFGMTGTWAEQNPEMVQRMVAEGHQLVNHSYSHPSLTGANTGEPPMTYDEIAEQYGHAEQIVRDLAGYEMKPFFRPPYGDYDATSLGSMY
ncbi:MAG: polysaccharide deacetylase family protein, partial [Thermomicrobiales bacterium]|nr:polysaccharide deacetylase family protein [Thermomicrobiales bacterium]